MCKEQYRRFKCNHRISLGLWKCSDPEIWFNKGVCIQGTHTEYIKALCTNCQKTTEAAKTPLPESPDEANPPKLDTFKIPRRNNSSDVTKEENDVETKKLTRRTWEVAHGTSEVSEAWWKNVLERFGEWLEANNLELITPGLTNDALIKIILLTKRLWKSR